MCSFGGFIVTYNRPEILLGTICQVLSQTCSLDFLWIIDNSEGPETLEAVSSLKNSRVRHFSMGYNAGPAGAAAKGLELCFGEGAEWIFWGDDNDPPPNEFIFENLFKMKELIPQNYQIGQIGMVGQRFDSRKGIISRISNEELLQAWVLVDNIGGGQTKIISSEVIESGITTNQHLFFGFEELDFDLKMKRFGFSSFVSGGLMLEQRKKYNTINKRKSKFYYFNDLGNWRAFYSHRNLLFILWENRLYLGFTNRLVALVLRPFFNLRFGIKPFSDQFKFTQRVLYGFFKLLNA